MESPHAALPPQDFPHRQVDRTPGQTLNWDEFILRRKIMVVFKAGQIFNEGKLVLQHKICLTYLGSIELFMALIANIET